MSTFHLALLVSCLTLTSSSVIVTRPADDSSTTAAPKKQPENPLDASMSSRKVPINEISEVYWKNTARRLLKQKLSEEKLNKNVAVNVIMFLGDGMSIPTLTSARIYKGQQEHKSGEESKLSFEEFPTAGLVKTYCVNAQVPDSACTATAYLCGAKNNYGTIGVDAAAQRGRCGGGRQLDSIAKWALDAGLDAGIVTTTRITHASPAGAYAHTAERDWENDSEVPADQASCRDIAYQLVAHEPGNKFKVILGGGKKNFLPNATHGGKRQDGVNLIELWHIDKLDKNASHKFVTDKDSLREAMAEEPEYLFGLFHDDHLEYHLQSNDSQPTLVDLTEAAIKTLQRSGKGYFLFVEGGRIDHAHHDSYARLALDETVEFSKAVQRAVEMTDAKETLVVVTSDHAHTMSMAGYPSRGNDILGIVDTGLTLDDVSYTTLSYANGNGYRPEVNGSRFDASTDEAFLNKNPMFRYPATVPASSETHGGDDVAIFARGPWQHLFTGHYEQHLIPHVMAYAMCLGDDPHHACKYYNSRNKQPYTERRSSSSSLLANPMVLLLSCTAAILKIFNLLSIGV